MDEERYPDPTSTPQHIDEGETRYQQEEESYEVNKEWTEAIVREEEYGELKEKGDDIIIENTEEEVYGEDDEQQLELQDESRKGTNEIQTEPSDTLTSDIVNENKEEEMYEEDDDEQQLQDELEIRNEITEKEVYEEDDEQQLELQDESEKGTNEIQTEPSDTLTSDIANEGTEKEVYEEDDEQLQDESEIIHANTEKEVYGEEDDEQQLQDEKGTNEIQIEPSDTLTSDIVNEGTEKEMYEEEDEQLQYESEIIHANTEKEVYGEEEDEQQLQDEKGTNEIQIEPSGTLTSDIVNEGTEKEVYEEEDEQLQYESEIIHANTEKEVYEEEDEQLQYESEIIHANTEKKVYGEEEDEQQLQDEKGTNEIQIEPSGTLTSDNLLTEKTKEMVIQNNSQIQENGDNDDQSYSPPLQPQINKENTPDYLGDDEQLMIQTPPSSTSSKRITPSSRDSKGKRRSSDKFKPTVVKPFSFSLERRLDERQKYDSKMHRVRKAQEDREKREKERRQKEEEEELKLQRKKLVPKANPVRHYSPIMITPSKKPLTLPDGPNLILESRKRNPKVGDQDNKIRHVL